MPCPCIACIGPAWCPAHGLNLASKAVAQARHGTFGQVPCLPPIHLLSAFLIATLQQQVPSVVTKRGALDRVLVDLYDVLVAQGASFKQASEADAELKHLDLYRSSAIYHGFAEHLLQGMLTGRQKIGRPGSRLHMLPVQLMICLPVG